MVNIEQTIGQKFHIYMIENSKIDIKLSTPFQAFRVDYSR